jgi:hypothetical protein
MVYVKKTVCKKRRKSKKKIKNYNRIFPVQNSDLAPLEYKLQASEEKQR